MKTCIILTVTVAVVLSLSPWASGQVIPPRATGTSTGGPSIDQAQREDAMGPKARVAVSRFDDKSAKGHYTGKIGDGMSEMLSNALFSTSRFIVLERQALGDTLREQNLGASGRIRADTAAPIGELEGAELLIQGTITEFEPGSSGGNGGLGGLLPGSLGRVAGAIGGSVRNSHVAMILKVIDAKTGRILASEQVEGKATDIGGTGGLRGSELAGVFGAYSKTPMEKAIRICVEEGVKLIVAKTPPEYYRAGVAPVQQSEPAKPPASVQSPSKSLIGGSTRMVYVKWPTTSLREGPGTNYKALVEVKKGTPLVVFEEKGPWVRVGLEDGQEGWIGKGTIADQP
jgi:curli biogenesis system outer membrane secretion channel CsgG